jgi:hypothetical protein
MKATNIIWKYPKEKMPSEETLPWQVYQYGESNEFAKGWLSGKYNNIVLSFAIELESEDLPF